MRRLALGLAVIASTALVQLCTGCSGAVQVVVHGDQDRAREALEGAQELLGVPLELSDRGPIRVTLQDAPPLTPAGETTPKGPCRFDVEAEPDPVTLAHEIGHAHGLQHHPDPANLMHPRTGPSSTTLTTRQRAKLQRRSRRLALCPGVTA